MPWAAAVQLWVAVALGIGGVLFVRRHGGSTALEELERANRVLERRVHELEQLNGELVGQVAALTATRDVSVAIAPVLEALTLHEERAGQRGETTAVLLQMIADRLGKDPEALAS